MNLYVFSVTYTSGEYNSKAFGIVPAESYSIALCTIEERYGKDVVDVYVSLIDKGTISISEAMFNEIIENA